MPPSAAIAGDAVIPSAASVRVAASRIVSVRFMVVSYTASDARTPCATCYHMYKILSHEINSYRRLSVSFASQNRLRKSYGFETVGQWTYSIRQQWVPIARWSNRGAVRLPATARRAVRRINNLYLIKRNIKYAFKCKIQFLQIVREVQHRTELVKSINNLSFPTLLRRHPNTYVEATGRTSTPRDHPRGRLRLVQRDARSGVS